MGLGRLNVFVSGLDEPCKIDDRMWYITLYDCDGRVFEWCGRRYGVIPARCGHLELELPPGIYTVLGVWSFGVGGGHIYGNHFTDHAIAQVCCGEHTCVTLYTPTAHRCGVLFDVALDVLQRHGRGEGGPPAELVDRAREAIRGVLEHLPQPARPFEIGNRDELMKALATPPGEDLPPEEPKG
jgi:hypothetical protein